jgi:hypothetical protein
MFADDVCDANEGVQFHGPYARDIEQMAQTPGNHHPGVALESLARTPCAPALDHSNGYHDGTKGHCQLV